MRQLLVAAATFPDSRVFAAAADHDQSLPRAMGSGADDAGRIDVSPVDGLCGGARSSHPHSAARGQRASGLRRGCGRAAHHADHGQGQRQASGDDLGSEDQEQSHDGDAENRRSDRADQRREGSGAETRNAEAVDQGRADFRRQGSDRMGADSHHGEEQLGGRGRRC